MLIADILLFAKIIEGDIKAFETLFKRFYSPLCLYCASITGEYEAAEEIVEELFYKLWKERETIKITLSVKGYLYGAAKFEAFNYLRHCNVKDRYAKSNPVMEKTATETPQEAMEYKELNIIINRTLNKLPARRLAIFNMHRYEGKKYSEIASKLSVSIKTVEAEMTKTLKFLRNEVEQYSHES
jgi:RNA polymerase sigma-70 factor, ECF subfamily